jgi:hypothetical protein
MTETGTNQDDSRTLLMRRTAEMAAIFMVGDGMLGLLQPKRHVALWQSDVAPAALVRFFDGKPGLRRAYGLLQLSAGLALASRQRRR